MSNKPETPRTSGLFAYIAESSDDGGKTWSIHNIEWSIGQAAAIADRDIPWATRIRRVKLSDDGLVDREAVKSALAEVEEIESIFSREHKNQP